MPSLGRPKLPRLIAGGKYEILKKIGAGCWSEVYKVRDVATQEEYAVKVSLPLGEQYADASVLQLEAGSAILKKLGGETVPGFARCIWFGKEGPYTFLVMDLLGKTLEEVLSMRGGRFDVRSTIMLAEQVLRRIEYLHSKGIVHRDIKPSNFLFGVGDKANELYMIDFGLSKQYYDEGHIKLRTRLSLTGTARFASIHALAGLEQSRRDDLEAIGHMLLFLVRGSLPWSGLEAKTKEEKWRKIWQKKQEVPLSTLCGGFPDAFEGYLAYCRSLGFVERPDYDMLRRLFHMALQDQGPSPQDFKLPWIREEVQPEHLQLSAWEPPAQPDDLKLDRKKGVMEKVFNFLLSLLVCDPCLRSP